MATGAASGQASQETEASGIEEAADRFAVRDIEEGVRGCEMKRGYTQPSDIEHATLLICKALGFVESGRVADAKKMMEEAVCILPDVENENQRIAQEKRRYLKELSEMF